MFHQSVPSVKKEKKAGPESEARALSKTILRHPSKWSAAAERRLYSAWETKTAALNIPNVPVSIACSCFFSLRPTAPE